MKKVYLVTASTKPEGLVVSEIFEDIDEALAFDEDGIEKQLEKEYGKEILESSSLTYGFATHILHEKKEK